LKGNRQRELPQCRTLWLVYIILVLLSRLERNTRIPGSVKLSTDNQALDTNRRNNKKSRLLTEMRTTANRRQWLHRQAVSHTSRSQVRNHPNKSLTRVLGA